MWKAHDFRKLSVARSLLGFHVLFDGRRRAAAAVAAAAVPARSTIAAAAVAAAAVAAVAVAAAAVADLAVIAPAAMPSAIGESWFDMERRSRRPARVLFAPSCSEGDATGDERLRVVECVALAGAVTATGVDRPAAAELDMGPRTQRTEG